MSRNRTIAVTGLVLIALAVAVGSVVLAAIGKPPLPDAIVAGLGGAAVGGIAGLVTQDLDR